MPWTALIIALSADSNSLTSNGLNFFSLSNCIASLSLRLTTASLKLSVYRSIQATHFYSRNHAEKRSNALLITGLVGWAKLMKVALLSSVTHGSSPPSSSRAAGRFGQFFSSCQRKHGPMNHRLLLVMVSTLIPLEASSAGLSFVSTYLHCSGEDRSRIADTRFAKNV